MSNLRSEVSVTDTLSPGLTPIFFRRPAGMTTCPLLEVVTTGIRFNGAYKG
jgi:hypothetical protein